MIDGALMENIGKEKGILSDHRSFKNLKLSEKIFVVILLILLSVVSIGVVFGLFFFGIAGFFRLFGVVYDSFYSLIWFVVLFFIIGFVMDLFANSFIKVITMNMSGKTSIFLASMLIDCTFTWIAFRIANLLVTSITIPLTTEISAVILMFFISVAFENKDKMYQQER